jgi:hypothetical protein
LLFAVINWSCLARCGNVHTCLWKSPNGILNFSQLLLDCGLGLNKTWYLHHQWKTLELV